MCMSLLLANQIQAFQWLLTRITHSFPHSLIPSLTCISLFVLSDVHVFAASLSIQEISQILLVDLNERHVDGEVPVVIILQVRNIQ